MHVEKMGAAPRVWSGQWLAQHLNPVGLQTHPPLCALPDLPLFSRLLSVDNTNVIFSRKGDCTGLKTNNTGVVLNLRFKSLSLFSYASFTPTNITPGGANDSFLVRGQCPEAVLPASEWAQG